MKKSLLIVIRNYSICLLAKSLSFQDFIHSQKLGKIKIMLILFKISNLTRFFFSILNFSFIYTSSIITLCYTHSSLNNNSTPTLSLTRTFRLHLGFFFVQLSSKILHHLLSFQAMCSVH